MCAVMQNSDTGVGWAYMRANRSDTRTRHSRICGFCILKIFCGLQIMKTGLWGAGGTETLWGLIAPHYIV